MTADLSVEGHERGRLHVLAVNLPETAVQGRHIAGDADTLQPDASLLADLTGADDLDPAGAELIRIADLEGFGLSGYLTEGHGIDAGAVAAQRGRLDRIEGYALLLRSQAFGGRGRTLRTAYLTPIASFDQPGADWTPGAPIEAESARLFTGPGAKPVPATPHAARIGSAVVAGVLVVLAVLIWSLLE